MVALSTQINGKSADRVAKKLFEKTVKTFLDVIILSECQRGPCSGFDVISMIRERFGFLVSSGTVYSLFYTLERYKLIEGSWCERKRVYKLTALGEQNLAFLQRAQPKIMGLLGTIFQSQSNQVKELIVHGE